MDNNNTDNNLDHYKYFKYYEAGKRQAAEEIYNFIQKVCFSKEHEDVMFRVDNGSRGQILKIMQFIQDRYKI